MKGKLTLQQRLILPVVLLGLITLLSNVLAVFSINNVHANAGTIVDEYMVSEGKLEEIRRSMMDIHLLALSHIVAADHATMIRLVQEIKAEEAVLDEQLAYYQGFVAGEDETAYNSLLEGYDAYFTALEALKAAKSTDPADVMAALPNVKYTGISGEIVFNEVGDADRHMAYIKVNNSETGVWDLAKVQEANAD